MSVLVCTSNTPWADAVRDMAGRVLQQHYPGYMWAVQANEKTGMCDIRCMHVSGNLGYRLHLKKIFSATSFEARVLKGAGEILERFNLSRSGFKEDQYMAAKTDRFGRLVGDVAR
jgi:hypothetical protein